VILKRDTYGTATHHRVRLFQGPPEHFVRQFHDKPPTGIVSVSPGSTVRAAGRVSGHEIILCLMQINSVSSCRNSYIRLKLTVAHDAYGKSADY
jgi:hypothetical protein